MSTTTAPKRGTVTDSLVRVFSEVFGTDKLAPGVLAQYNIDRKDEIDLAGIATLSNVDPLFLGDPGVGKTHLIELLLDSLDGATEEDFFNTLVFKETPAQDVLGPMNPSAMKDGRIERVMDGFLPMSRIAYLDEVFKASPTLLNSILDLMANRKLKVGRNVHRASQLLVIFGSSNELPDREDLSAFRDRFGITKIVQPVRTPEDRMAVMRIQDAAQAGGGIDLSGAPKISLDDLSEMRSEVACIEVPDTVYEALASAIEKWEGHGFLPSTRRVGQMLRAMKAQAWIAGRGHVTTDDMLLLQHMAWNHPDHMRPAHDVVMEFANAFARKAARMKEALEPVLTEIQGVRDELNTGGNPDDHMETGFKAMRDLRRLRREAKEEIDKGTNQGHDTRDLENVLAEIEKAHGWVESTLAGDDE